MFSKILIANRGEIADRISRTCRKLGIKTTAIYSAADINALHVRAADEVRFVPKAPSGQVGYLNREAILKIAQDAGAEAIHPGYGFVSESPAFARRCEEEGVVFIGPRPKTIEAMGDKARALEFAKACGVPTLPRSSLITEETEGSHILEIIEDFMEEIQSSSFLVKPSGGGGGLGMELISAQQSPCAQDVLPIIKRSRDVAKKAFGNGDVYMEKYVSGGSHIEVQILGDEQGKIVHLFHRDCSIQRRSQKIIEEGPSPKVPAGLERALYEHTLRLARGAGYTNAGTAEFLVTGKGEVHFLEMNTRLQVEHGVTEMITGLDLVELQIRVAAGEPLPFSQEDVRITGHAIEARIYPETLQGGNFALQLGSAACYEPPQQTNNVRFDSALCEGYKVLLDYEPLMGKLICRGQDRKGALAKLDASLESFTVMGVPTNINLIRSIVGHEMFRTGAYHTGSLADQTVLESLERTVAKLDFEDLEKRLRRHVASLV